MPEAAAVNLAPRTDTGDTRRMNTRFDNPRLRYAGDRGRGFLRAGASGLLGRALAIAAGGVILVAGLFVSAVVFSVMLVVGLVAGGWLWWKTRHLRRDLRHRMDEMRRMHGGEAAGDPLQEAFRGSFRGEPFRGAARGRDDGVIDGDYIRDPDRPTR